MGDLPGRPAAAQRGVVVTVLAEATKDDLILAALAVLGGETREVNERDLFLTAWHAFPSTMRWVDTALPNPDTFTAALRRLDQRGYIRRVGKQQRSARGRSRRRGPLDAGRSGVVKARIVDGALERAGISPELVEEVRELVPDADAIRGLSDPALIVLCVALREEGSRHLDEGAIVELAFHKFPSRFAYEARPEFPDVGRVRAAIGDARADGLLDAALALTRGGRSRAEMWRGSLHVKLDASRAHAAGDLKFAARIEASPGFQAYAENGTVVRTKPDELFRMLRVPPTTDPRPVAEILRTRLRALRRIDKGDVAAYLIEVARRHNPDVASLLPEESNITE
jgi:hypothetical protein